MSLRRSTNTTAIGPVAYCPEVPGANGQGCTKEGARQGLAEAINVLLEHHRENGLRGVPLTGAAEAIPRHTEIANSLAATICRRLGVPQVGAA